jgi:hypothetical protein
LAALLALARGTRLEVTRRSFSNKDALRLCLLRRKMKDE